MKSYPENQFMESIPSCVECGQDMYDETYKTPLCSCCRQKFIKYPVPFSVKIFGTVILVTALFSLYSLSQSLKNNSLQKGEWAAIRHNNGTAEVHTAEAEKSLNYEMIN